MVFYPKGVLRKYRGFYDGVVGLTFFLSLSSKDFRVHFINHDTTIYQQEFNREGVGGKVLKIDVLCTTRRWNIHEARLDGW